VLVADEDPNVRRCLKKALECECKLSVLWEADNGLQALALMHKQRPEVVLIDSQMQRMSGIEATRCFRRCNSATKIVVMSVYESDRETAMQAGADAFIIKDSGCKAIRSAVYGLLKCDKQ
jgi:DNA-binding NarL/FixJ family response regulator